MKNNTFHSHPQSKPDQQEHQQKEELSPFIKRILIVDDHPDVILTFKSLSIGTSILLIEGIPGSKHCDRESNPILYTSN